MVSIVTVSPGNFNPHSPWGERLLILASVSHLLSFQSTLPVGGATSSRLDPLNKIIMISIHTPRGGSDNNVCGHYNSTINFNPHSPWGERPTIHVEYCANSHFNPHSPWGERLAIDYYNIGGDTISIHTPRGGSDSKDAQILFASLARVNNFSSPGVRGGQSGAGVGGGLGVFGAEWWCEPGGKGWALWVRIQTRRVPSGW